ncbi:hypothetical protein MRB53_026959 [Persea americana]|uniref:Uncharacterized protein n=1 Tax=Persea americana TaxID=3435 RepID=A0ACC2LJS8_PERAE|nr:hypothetical protein MRB53_026959 [Persea americana]
MFTALIVVNCWAGNMKKLMRKVRSTKKENTYLKSQILSRKTGSIQGFAVLKSLKFPREFLMMLPIFHSKRLLCSIISSAGTTIRWQPVKAFQPGISFVINKSSSLP